MPRNGSFNRSATGMASGPRGARSAPSQAGSRPIVGALRHPPMKPFTDPAVEAHFLSYPAPVKKKLLAVRELIFEVAAGTQGVGELLETLKWGEPAYITAQSKSGSAVRMDWKAKTPGQYAVYFNCNTGLVDLFRSLFPEDFRYEGRRAIVLEVDGRIPKDALAVCIEASLTHHARRKRQAASRQAPKAP